MMKRVVAVFVAALMIVSLFGALGVHAAGGLSCLDFIYLLDAEKEIVETIPSAKRNLGNISNTVQAVGAKYLRLQGWHSEDVEVADIGYSLDGEAVVWGFAWLDEKLVANKVATGHEYPMRYSVDIPLTIGEDFEIELWYKLVDGEEDTFESTFVFKFSNMPTGDKFINVPDGNYKFVDSEIAPKGKTISVVGADPAAKDWIGIFHAEGLDPKDPEVDEDSFTGWKTVVESNSIDFSAEMLRQDGSEDLVPGGYVIALLKDNSYDVISFQIININAPAADIRHFDVVAVKDVEPAYDTNERDLGNITAEFKDGHDSIYLYGWAASDKEIKSIAYRYEDGREDEFVGKSRPDASTAAGTLYAMCIDVLVPIVEGDMTFDLLVKYADGTESLIDSFEYVCGDDVPVKTAAPTETPEETAAPEETDAPEETAAPEEPTEEIPEATDAPEETKKPDSGKKGCGGIVSGSAAMLLLAGAMLIVRKKH
ncbi:MAG: hypothetical protein IKX06_03020 [Clostridia bacterium]|nr:hypothetical protein [Clostridia bacterium]